MAFFIGLYRYKGRACAAGRVEDAAAELYPLRHSYFQSFKKKLVRKPHHQVETDKERLDSAAESARRS